VWAGWDPARPALLFPLPLVAGAEQTYEAVGGGTRFWLQSVNPDEDARWGWAQLLQPTTPAHVLVRGAHTAGRARGRARAPEAVPPALLLRSLLQPAASSVTPRARRTLTRP
jgi:hypothetical protein